MAILVTGARGQLGRDLMRELKARGLPAIGVDREEFDIGDARAVREGLGGFEFSAILHAAAYTAVDRAEVEAEACYRANALGTRHMAMAAREHGARLLYISTDYVFSGFDKTPYEVIDDTVPRNIYGCSKLAGEREIEKLLSDAFVVRIAWAFGLKGQNFAKTMLRLGAGQDSVRVVDDQVGSPTYTRDVAPLLIDILLSGKYGTYHATNEGFCSFADWAQELYRCAGMDTRVVRIPTREYPTPAARPLNSRLSKASLDAGGFARLPTWQDATARFVGEVLK